LFNAERKVADYILDNLNEAVHMNVAQIASACGVSDATVIRMCKHLGYKGYYQMKVRLAQNLGETKIIGSDIENLKVDSVKAFFKVCSYNMHKIGSSLDSATVKKVVKAIVEANTVHIIGFGNTTNVVLDFAFRLSRMKIATTCSHSDELELSSINLARYGDIVIGVSHSGGSVCVIKALTIARAKGLTTVAITDLEDSPVQQIADFTLCSTIEASKIYVFGAESHINIHAIVDLLLFLIAQEKTTETGLEMFLSETQLTN
jgi:DNA-binding MurR/RpiR family transcriptional regulator